MGPPFTSLPIKRNKHIYVHVGLDNHVLHTYLAIAMLLFYSSSEAFSERTK